MHRYLEMLRTMLVARNTYERTKLQLEGPRVAVLVKLVREATGLNQSDLADRLNVDPTYLSKVVNEKCDAGFPLLEKLYYEWEGTQSLDDLTLPKRLAHPPQAFKSSEEMRLEPVPTQTPSRTEVAQP